MINFYHRVPGVASVNNYVTNGLQRETERTELMENSEDTNQVKR